MLRLQSSTSTLLKEVSALSSTTYHYKPGIEKWSISQILTHLVTSEKLSVSYMKKKALGMETLDNAGMMEDLKFLALKFSQRIPLKYKAPDVVRNATPTPLSFGELVRTWEEVRSELRDFLDQVQPQDLNKKIYKHPFAGRLSAVHALRFMNEHLIHHRPQIRTIIRQQRSKHARKS